MIIKMENYANERGMLVQERTRVDLPIPGEKEVVFDRFLGTVGIAVNTQMGTQMQQIEFTIPAKSLKEAFEIFEKSARAHVQKLQDDANKKIVVARPGPPPMPGPRKGLIMP
jgi:hypothetical protein